MASQFYILSVDGGGLKGLIAIKILQILESLTRKKIVDAFDLMAGTSTGGLIVSALAVHNDGVPLHDLSHIENIYIEVGQTVFRNGGISLTGKETAALDKILKETLSEMKIAEALVPVFIPSWDQKNHRLIVFKSRAGEQDPSKNVKLRDACRATSAIEPVFPPYKMKYNGRELHAVDAGYHLKNPALSALAEVWKHKKYYGVEKESQISLLSVSTGNYHGSEKDWTTDINAIVHHQTKDMRYIQDQSLKIDLEKVDFLRVDLNLGGSSFSLLQFLQWMERISELSRNKAFASDVTRFFRHQA